MEICLSYHLCGTCYSNGKRRQTHCPLQAAERTAMTNFIASRVPSQSNTPQGPP